MRAPLIRKLFEEYATGVCTIRQLVKKTKEWGLTNSRGNQGSLCRSHVHSILTNPFYHGVMHYQKGNKFYPHIYPPIISKDLFDSCGAVLKGWNKKPFKWGEKDYIFRGIITCAATARVVSAETKKRTLADGSDYEVTYLGAWNPNNPTKKVYVSEEIILKEVEQIFASMHVEPELLTKIVEYIKSSLEDKISEKEHDEKRSQLIARREKIMNELDAHNNADDSFNDTIIDVLNLASNAHEIFRLSTNEKKRKLINLVRIDQ